MVNDNSSKPTLYEYFGTANPHWYLTTDSDALQLSEDGEVVVLAIPLTSTQAKEIRFLSGVTAHVVLQVSIFGEETTLHLIGRKINFSLWSGTASDNRNMSGVVHGLSTGLSFAEHIVSEVNCLVVVIDSEGKIVRFNRLCEEKTGKSEKEMLGKNAHDMFMPEVEHDAARSNIKDFFKGAETFSVLRPVRSLAGIRQIMWRNKIVESGSGKKEKFLLCAGTDITEELKAKERLVEIANTDLLTGLPNRYAIQEIISTRIQERNTSPFGLIYFDLDNFKLINDHYGHLFGDEIIQSVAVSLRSWLNEDCAISRLGGDEFLIVAPATDLVTIETLAKYILEKIQLPITFNQSEIFCTCSIGVVMYPDHGSTPEELLRNADTAMYVAKDDGRNAIRTFTKEMHQRISDYVWLDSNIRKALADGQFELYYQPKQSLSSGRNESVDACVRWNSPERGLIDQKMFLSYAEESGFIVPLGKWIMAQAAKQASEWKKIGRKIRISINISPRQLQNPSLVTDLKSALDAAKIFPSLLDIEFTETCLIKNEALALEATNGFQNLGAQIHLDDFGTGYSSITQLTRLPFNLLKLNREFISAIHHNDRAQRLLRSMVAVCRELQMIIVAEGVETNEQAEFLRDIGVEYAQGYLLTKPMPSNEILAWFSHSDTN